MYVVLRKELSCNDSSIIKNDKEMSVKEETRS